MGQQKHGGRVELVGTSGCLHPLALSAFRPQVPGQTVCGAGRKETAF